MIGKLTAPRAACALAFAWAACALTGAGAFAPAAARAQSNAQTPRGDSIPLYGIGVPSCGVVGSTAATGQPCGLDPNNAAFQGEVALSVGVADTAGRRSLKATCTAAGVVSVAYADGSTGVWPVVVGAQTLPISITTVNTAGTTAACAYANLK